MLEFILPPARSNLFPWLGGIGCIVVRPEVESLVVQPAMDWQNLAQQVHPPFANETVLKAMFSVAEQLNPRLASYDLVIGDDTSGRLPALLYRRLINRRREELGLEKAPLRFVNGRYEGELSDGLLPPASTDTSRALIVTESICSGGSIERLYRGASKQRDPRRLDIATVAAWTTKISLESGSNFFIGSTSDVEVLDGNLYTGSNAAKKGVEKSFGQPHTKRLRKRDSNMQQFRQARGDIELIADRFAALLPSS